MATISITVDKPIIKSPETFGIYYRLLGDTIWTFFANRTNATFTLTVPTEGTYEIRVDRLDCPSVIYTPIEVIAQCDCPNVTSANIVYQDALTSFLVLTFSGSPTTGACGYEIEVIEGSTGVSKKYGTTAAGLLPNPLTTYIKSRENYSYILRINCCAGKVYICAQGQVNAPALSCTSVALKNEGVTGHRANIVGGGYELEILFQQSAPISVPLQVTRNQLTYGAPPTAGCVADVDTALYFPVASGDLTYPWKVIVPCTPGSCYQPFYQVFVTDVCGKQIFWL